MSRHRYRRKVVIPIICTAAAVTGLAAAIAVPALARPAPTPAVAAAARGDVLDALQRDLRLPPDKVKQRLAGETSAAQRIRELRQGLGDSYAGAWFDAATGKPVIGVTDPRQAARLRSTGIESTVVTHSMTTLAATKNRIDQLAANAPDAVTGWYVEPKSNAVVVEVDPAGQDARTTQFLKGAKASDAVRVQRATARPRPLADIVGGAPFTFAAGGGQARCSIGFAATDSGGGKHFLTAGHCTEAGGTAVGADGGEIGPITQSTFGRDGDFGLVDVTDPDARLQPAVLRSRQTVIPVTGSSPADVGSTVCRSGSTSGFHCGEIQALNQTVNYGNGKIVRGLTRTTACAEGGDSGGPFVSGGQAQGMTSGGSGDCASGGVTFFQPVGEALQQFGLTLVTSGP
ncbi:S1 family peptidase [Amycolatopsis sp. NPDC059021]|uniref:S1 family peptidase n=1 Tax=Amycolatopsis sp. NPDC059021 TaxID=3346704 RepID=UPI00367182A5